MDGVIVILLLAAIFGEIALYATFKNLEKKMMGEDEEF